MEPHAVSVLCVLKHPATAGHTHTHAHTELTPTTVTRAAGGGTRTGLGQLWGAWLTAGNRFNCTVTGRVRMEPEED